MTELHVIRGMLSLDMSMECVEKLIPATNAMLPLGGNALEQLGILAIIAVVIIEVSEVAKKISISRRRRRTSMKRMIDRNT